MTESQIPFFYTPSPNFNDRAGGAWPSLVVLHYTGTFTGDEAAAYYLNQSKDEKAGPISPHYMIDRDGSITQFVDEDKRAWHAGKSWWAGVEDINSHSIGIELVNPGHDNGYIPFAEAQMQSLLELLRGVVSRHGIQPGGILGHSDVSPAIARNKSDPGELFDWAWLNRHGIGLWPRTRAADYAGGQAFLEDEQTLRDALTAFGYDPRVPLYEVVLAFQRHYQPDAVAEGRGGQADDEMAARLYSLLHR